MFMRLSTLGLLCLFTLDVSAQNHQLEDLVACGSGPTELAYGQYVRCQIDDNVDTDQFTFYAKADDRVAITLKKEGGGKNPRVEVVSPGGVTQTFSAGFGDYDANVFPIESAYSGLYTINVRDPTAQAAGAYRLQVDSNQTALDDTPLQYGAKSRHRMDFARDRDYFAVDLKEGTTVQITLAKFTDLFNSTIQVIDPYGEAYGLPSSTGFSVNDQVTIELPVIMSGLYTLEISDPKTPGYYELFVACKEGNCPAGGKPQPSLDYLAGIAESRRISNLDAAQDDPLVVDMIMTKVNPDLSISLPILRYGINPPEFLRAELEYKEELRCWGLKSLGTPDD